MVWAFALPRFVGAFAVSALYLLAVAFTGFMVLGTLATYWFLCADVCFVSVSLEIKALFDLALGYVSAGLIIPASNAGGLLDEAFAAGAIAVGRAQVTSALGEDFSTVYPIILLVTSTLKQPFQ